MGILILLGGCGGSSADAAACDQWQKKVRAAYRDNEGGALRYINLRTDEDMAAEVPGRPDDCSVPTSDS